MEEHIMAMENESKNQKNELMTAKSEARNWEKQLEKEREKVIKLKEEKKFSIEEVWFNIIIDTINYFKLKNN